MLPRDFDSPASLLAAVYASEKLKAWAQRQYERGKIAEAGGRRSKKGSDLGDDDVAVGMGYFTSADGEQHWGIEVVDDRPLLLEKARREDDSKAVVEDEESVNSVRG